MSDTDSDPMAEAYHVLGALRYQQDQAKQALQQQISVIAQKGDELTKQLEEAQQLDDGDAIERITQEIEDLHRAYALASDELEQHEPGQPQDTPEEDDSDAAPDSGRAAGRDQADIQEAPGDRPGMP